MSAHLALGPGAEFDAIRELLDVWGPRAAGIGDDAALVAVPRGDQVVASVDCAVEGRHFQPGWLTPREIGYRAAAAALSDLAAMAATPSGALISIALPHAWRARLGELAAGMGDALDAAHASVLGGNLSGANELSITTTVLGSVFSPLSRRGARPGDAVYVTGRLGGVGAALADLRAGGSGGAHRERFAHPVPRLAEARWLAARGGGGGASSGIDLSDGLLADLGHLARASEVAMELDATLVPRAEGITVEHALQSGEEYELIVTAADGLDADEFLERFGLPLTRIGRIRAGKDHAVRVTGLVGAPVVPAAGFDHLSH